MDDAFDLVLAGGHLVDPAQSLDGEFDLAIRDGRVAAVLPRGTRAEARERIDVRGRLLIPGMIDTHAHVFQYVTGRFGLEADLCGVRSGVTTLIDQGGPSCMTLPAFREFVVKPKRTRVFAYLSGYLVTFFTRPDRVNVQQETVNALDPEAVASQVELIGSRDIARRAIAQLKLAGNPEFDPLAGGLNPFTRVLVLLGIVPDPTRESAEARIVTKFLEKLTVFSPPKTRVITIQFTSRDPALAAKTANTIAQLYLQVQSAAKRATAKQSAEALSAQIDDLRTKLASADDERERYRLQSGLLAGSNNMTISGQQLADINADLSKARSAQADAQAKATLIRELIRSGKTADVPDVINNDTVRRVADQRFLAQAQLARESRTLLPGHPRVKELAAQVAEFDQALKTAAKQAAVSLENESRIAGQRVTNLESVLTQQKQVAGVANSDEVHLRALERVAQSYKDQLESSTTKYQEALARQSSAATPADARIISGAARPQEPSFPKKVPFILFGTIAAFVLSLGFVVASELLSGSAAPLAFAPVATRPARVEPEVEEPALRRQPAWSFPEDVSHEDAPRDPVFAPVAKVEARARPSMDKLRTLAAGGMVAATLDYLKNFGRSAAAARGEHAVPRVKAKPTSTFGWDQDEAGDVPATAPIAPPPLDVAPIADQIIAAHVPGRGLHIVGTGLGNGDAPAILIDLGRNLSSRGRSIIVDLNRSPESLHTLTRDTGSVATMHGLAELLAGDASFAEVIHRDQDSRLHFIASGLQEADFRDFDLILDALSETYDFIVLMTPAFPQSEIAKIMAPYADFVVLAASEAPGSRSLADIEGELILAGARDVLFAGAPSGIARVVA